MSDYNPDFDYDYIATRLKPKSNATEEMILAELRRVTARPTELLGMASTSAPDELPKHVVDWTSGVYAKAFSVDPLTIRGNSIDWAAFDEARRLPPRDLDTWFPTRLSERKVRHYAQLIFPDIHLKQTRFVLITYRPGTPLPEFVAEHTLKPLPVIRPADTYPVFLETTLKTTAVHFQRWTYFGRRYAVRMILDYQDADDVCFIGVPHDKPPVSFMSTGGCYLLPRSQRRQAG